MKRNMNNRKRASSTTPPSTTMWRNIVLVVLLAFIGMMAIFPPAAAATTDTTPTPTTTSTPPSPSSPGGAFIGIDLGTTYSVVGVVKNGHVEIIANDQGNRITPSYVAWDPSAGDRLIGDAAKHQATTNPENTVFDVKRLIGRNFDDRSVQADSKLLPYKIVDKDNTPNVQVCTHRHEYCRRWLHYAERSTLWKLAAYVLKPA